MKKFLLKISVFLAFSVAVFGGAYAVYFARLRTMSFAISPENKIVFIGDSHIEIGVNETLIPGAFNFAKSGDPYFDQYFRLKRLLDDNPQISLVFVSATPHSLARYGDARIFGDWTMQNVIPSALPLYSAREWKMYFSREPVRMTKFIFGKPGVLAKNALNALASRREKMMGALGKRIVSTGENLERSVRVERGIIPGKKLHGNDSVGNAHQVEYLRKSVELVRERGAKIVFLNPPIYRAREFFDVAYFENVLKENFSDVEFWDYGDFPLPDNCRQDINHINFRGAEIFSRELAERIKREFVGVSAKS